MSKDDQPRRRFIIAFPFSSGCCRSRSSVDTTTRRAGKKPHHQGSGSSSGAAAGGGAPRKSLVARLLRGFKNLSSQIFALHDDEEEEEEREMVIGLPTDVKHVAHMGWDGSTSTTTSLRSWNNARAVPQQQQQPAATAAAHPLPALSVRQFEHAMAAQAVAATDTTASDSELVGRRSTYVVRPRDRSLSVHHHHHKPVSASAVRLRSAA